MDSRKILEARFYRNPQSGREPVRDWLLTLPRSDRKRIGADIATVEYGPLACVHEEDAYHPNAEIEIALERKGDVS